MPLTVNVFSRLQALVSGSPVDVEMVTDSNESGKALPVLDDAARTSLASIDTKIATPLVTEAYDAIDITYDGGGNATVLSFTLAAVEVAELTITYTGGNATRIERTA